MEAATVVPRISRLGLRPFADFERKFPTAPRLSNSPLPTLVPANRVLFWQDDHQRQEIRVVRGVVRAVRLLENGTRQILAFYWPGEVIPSARAEAQFFTAEAVTACHLRWSSAPPNVSSTDRLLQAMLALVLAIGKKSTVPRIAWFLLRIRPHLPADLHRAGAQQLLLPRADISDHLGTSIETVCRTLHDFQNKGIIAMPSRKTIRFLDVPGLARIAEH